MKFINDWFGYIGLCGTPVEKTKYTHPYSYDEFVVFISPEYNGDFDSAVYSDRIYQWDYKKHDKLCEKYFGNHLKMWDNRQPALVEKFLQDYFDYPNLKLMAIVEGCNVSSGFPYWIFYFDKENK